MAHLLAQMSKIALPPPESPTPARNEFLRPASAEYDLLRDELIIMHSAGNSFAEIARRFNPPITRAHIYKIILEGWQPKKHITQLALGLSLQPPSVVSPLPGAVVTPGSLTLGSVVCPGCGRSYIPNHPARKGCYICNPQRRRKTTPI